MLVINNEPLTVCRQSTESVTITENLIVINYSKDLFPPFCSLKPIFF